MTASVYNLHVDLAHLKRNVKENTRTSAIVRESRNKRSIVNFVVELYLHRCSLSTIIVMRTYKRSYSQH